MFKKISILVLLLNMSAVSQTWSSDMGSGHVKMAGSIIDTACAIDINSIDQTLDMGVVPIGRIIRDGYSLKKSITINLVKCILNKNDENLNQWKYFTITFDGMNDEGLFNIEGDAKGIALRIIDSDGNVAKPGAPLPSGELKSGKMSLNYSIQLVSNHKALHAGEYNSIVKYKMDYY
ncbi:type 1 fimbrial protein [Erwinia sp. S43]|uniref:fimbrial protein n=1 Tax=unclassified Erwinia TaxID=2622719 RepID=UPI00190A051A|nr:MULTISPECIES: fimbrial protein [unclassified Erwinia]MBK0033133.1 type 1 fimbrial protein [Erwinia sp. S43]MCW1875851.1 type 1 fimbrial protein [Erwinia sp. INIA01]